MAINFPDAPIIGQQHTAGATTWQWDGTGWNIVPQMGPIFIGDLPPTNPAIGQEWWRASNGQLYIWYDDGNSKQWVQAAAAAQMASPWEPVIKEEFTGATTLLYPNLGAFREFRGTFEGNIPGATAGSFTFQFSTDNGATWVSGASDYFQQELSGSATDVPISQVRSVAAFAPSKGATLVAGSAQIGIRSHLEWGNFNKALAKRALMSSFCRVTPSNPYIKIEIGGIAPALACNALRFVCSVPMDGFVFMEAMRG